MNYARDWAIRIMLEARENLDNSFVTLTYDDEHLPVNGSLVKDAIAKFVRAVRIRGYKCRYYGCGEYGDRTFRPHYHLILFGISPKSDLWKEAVYFPKKKGWSVKCDAWTKGKIFVANVSLATANYVAGYMLKKQKGKDTIYVEKGIKEPFSRQSSRPGIAFSWLSRHLDDLRRNPFLDYKGHRIPLPRYFFQRTFSVDERLALAQNRSLEKAETFFKASADERQNFRQMYEDRTLSPEQQKQVQMNIASAFDFYRGTTEE